MGSGSSSNIRLEHQPCPNFLNFMPDNKIIPKATLPLITKHGELVKSATAAIIIPLRPPNEVLENMNIVSEDRKPLSKKQQEEMRQLRGLSSCFLVMYDVSLDGRLAPTAAVAPTAPPTAGGVTVGKGFNFNFVMPKPEPPAPENGKCVVASSGKTTGVAPGFRPPPPGDDDMGGPLSSMASFNGSVKSVLIHQSSFRGKDTGNSVSRGRTQRLAKIKVAQRTHYNIFNDSQTHEAYVTITYYYTASKEEETRLLCEPTKSKMLPVEGVDGTISQPYVEVQPDIPSSVLRKKILENAQLKQESKDLFSQLPDKKGMVNQVTMVLPPGVAVAVVESSEVKAYSIETLMIPFKPKSSLALRGQKTTSNEVLTMREKYRAMDEKKKKKNKVFEYNLAYVSSTLDVDEDLPSPFANEDLDDLLPAPLSAPAGKKISLHVEGVDYVDSPTEVSLNVTSGRKGPTSSSPSASPSRKVIANVPSQRRLGNTPDNASEPTSKSPPPSADQPNSERKARRLAGREDTAAEESSSPVQDIVAPFVTPAANKAPAPKRAPANGRKKLAVNRMNASKTDEVKSPASETSDISYISV